jgi:hypothetical protein
MTLTSRISGMRVRLRLTLLYGVLFLLSGAVLLAITYLLLTRSDSGVGMSTSASPSGNQSISIIVGGRLPDDAPLTDAERSLAGAVQKQAEEPRGHRGRVARPIGDSTRIAQAVRRERRARVADADDRRARPSRGGGDGSGRDPGRVPGPFRGSDGGERAAGPAARLPPGAGDQRTRTGLAGRWATANYWRSWGRPAPASPRC